MADHATGSNKQNHDLLGKCIVCRFAAAIECLLISPPLPDAQPVTHDLLPPLATAQPMTHDPSPPLAHAQPEVAPLLAHTQPEVAVLLAPGVDASSPLPLLVLATPLLVKLAIEAPAALPAGAVAKLELLLLELAEEAGAVTGGLKLTKLAGFCCWGNCVPESSHRGLSHCTEA